MTMKAFFCLLSAVCIFTVYASEPAGYYNTAEGKNGAQLKTQLFTIVGPHIERSYDQLWTDFQSTDKRSDGKVWDMYSNCNFTFGTDQDNGSGGTSECQFYNREHSFPNSWFAKATPMYSDLFHMYPTDKYVNNSRGNNPFGETTSASKTFINGSKLGACSVSGYTGTVYEPVNEYKGDFARSYFYMVTAYDDKVANWQSDQLAGNKYPAFANWCIAMLLKWSANDPVSPKELARNEAVYSIQHNRNPFIDHPELAEYIWGSKKDSPWSATAFLQLNTTPHLLRNKMISNTLELNRPIDNLMLEIINLQGKTIDKSYIGDQTTIPIKHLPDGLYIIKFFNNEDFTSTERIVVSTKH